MITISFICLYLCSGMDITQDISNVDERERIINALYMYSVIYVKKSKWLSLKERGLYAAMLEHFCSGKPMKKGWISGLSGKGVPKGSRYVYVSRIKDSGWITMKGREHVFHDGIVSFVKEILNKGKVNFIVKT